MFGSSHDTSQLARIERKLDILLQHHGLEYEPFDGLPEPIRDALRRGRKIEAIKLYREATGAGLREAKDAIDEAGG